MRAESSINLRLKCRPQGLDMVLSEGGAPLSAGQKQLAALARALLKRSKVVPPQTTGILEHLPPERKVMLSSC